jgi:hypothetical protein
MATNRYRYQPLQNNDTIRILTLDSGQPYDPLTGSLQAVPMDLAGSYEAVSYVWAEPGLPETAYEIDIRNGDGNSEVLALRGGSIFAALRQLRLPDRSRRIWADQCCINQDDLVERSQQVQFMNRIYSNAAHILVWLGLDVKKEADASFKLVHQLDEILKRRCLGDMCYDTDSLELERYVEENHTTLQALTDRTWVRFHEKITKARITRATSR